MRIAYVNGRYVPLQHAQVPMEDRGYQFADGIYEVIVFYNRLFLDEQPHIARLHQSLEQLNIPAPMSEPALRLIMRQMVAKNPYTNGFIYLQITRGMARRNHVFSQPLQPSVTMSVMPEKRLPDDCYDEGIRVITHPDQRWARCDIKSIALLPNVLARQQAAEEGAREALLFDAQDCLREGTLSSAFVVRGGEVHTHPDGPEVLPGVRKQVMHRLCEELGIVWRERAIPREEVLSADEVFLTSANSHVLPVTSIDGARIGAGRIGAVTGRLLAAYRDHVTQQTGKQWN